MKPKSILISAIGLTLIIETILIILLFGKVGTERLPFQVARVIIQLIFISLLFSSHFKSGILLLMGYHIFTCIIIFYRYDFLGLTQLAFGYYHLAIGIIIYFHDWIEKLLEKKRKNVA